MFGYTICSVNYLELWNPDLYQ